MAEVVVLAALTEVGNAMASELVRRMFSESYEIEGCCSCRPKVGFANLEGSVNKIGNQLRQIQDFIEHIDSHDESNKFQETWINAVRQLSYEIEDTIAEFVYLVENNSNRERRVCWLFYDSNSSIALKRVASQILEAQSKIDDLVEQRNTWVPTTNSRTSNIPDHSNERSENIVAETSRTIPGDNIVGIEENRFKLTSMLNSGEQQLSILSVWGMGGVGKTTLVANVFKREKTNFDCNAWITISQHYTVGNILRSLISDICKNAKIDQIDTSKMTISELIEYIQNLLRNKKYLIVLDDVWESEAFENIRNAFIANHRRRGRIIITSRDHQVASLAPESNRLELKSLNKNNSLELFCRKAFPFERNYECPSHLNKLAWQIIEKCDGLPLALASLGSLLSLYEPKESEWKLVYHQLSSLLQDNSTLTPVKKILNLSFINLPGHLKNCFLYCSLFPEDSLIQRKKLLRFWIAEGFVEQKGSILEEVAEGYLKELIRRSMLQVVEKNNSGRVKRCRMHDIQRELAIFLCKKENFGFLHDNNNHVDPSVRRFSIAERSVEIGHSVYLPKLRSFMYFDATHNVLSSWLSLILKNSRYLVTLDLEGVPIETVPNVIGYLFNLHYLGLRKTMVKILPKSIKKLHNLKTLDLAYSQIEKLPDGIIELKKLRHLFAEVLIDNTFKSIRAVTGVKLPKDMFYLKEIHTIQAVESNDMVVRELCNLTQLRSFRILNVKEDHSTELCKSLSKMSSLSQLSINASNENEILDLEGLHLPKIEKLELSGRLRESMLNSPLFQTSGEGIQELWLAWSQLRNDPLSSLSHLRNLTLLYLNKAYERHQLIFQRGWFPKLKLLTLKRMPNLTNVEMEQGTLKSLEEIRLRELTQLMEIPNDIKHLSSLKWMVCTDMPVEFGGLAEGRHKLFHFTCVIQYLS